jgi:hypothetical protein
MELIELFRLYDRGYPFQANVFIYWWIHVDNACNLESLLRGREVES